MPSNKVCCCELTSGPRLGDDGLRQLRHLENSTMRSSLRSAAVGLLVSMMVIDPAIACRNCGQSWGYGGGYSYVSYESSSCYLPCQSCGGEVVVSEPCSGCSSCQSCGGCPSCGGCSSCGSGGQIPQSEGPSPGSPPMMAPEPPASQPMSTPPAPKMPATQSA